MLYEYLEENYKPNEPIFVSDVQLPVSAVNLRKMFKELCDSGKINRFDKAESVKGWCTIRGRCGCKSKIYL